MNIPYHPLLIHFPIGFIFSALVLQTIYILKPNWACKIGGIWLTGFAAIFSLLASITGQIEYKKALSMNYSSEIMKTLETHQTMGNIFTWTIIIFAIVWINLFFRKMDDRRIDVFALAVLLFLSIGAILTSYYGGTLVWEYGVGINEPI
tara:strand:- start:27 stop:473 length:447 start_codon:yes stop_codon:yes gene_type:complete